LKNAVWKLVGRAHKPQTYCMKVEETERARGRFEERLQKWIWLRL